MRLELSSADPMFNQQRGQYMSCSLSERYDVALGPEREETERWMIVSKKTNHQVEKTKTLSKVGSILSKDCKI